MSGAAGRGEAAELWLPVSAELISGVHHALNNRLGALSAVAQVLEAEMGARHPLRQALVDEVNRLQVTVRTLSLLPRRAGAPAEPVHLPDLIPGIVELYGYHHGVRDTPCEVEGQSDLLPLFCEPTLLAHLLLVMLVAAGEVARAAGTRVQLLTAGSATEVVVTIEAEPGEAGAAGGAGAGGEMAPDAASLRPWAAELGGEVAGGAGRYELRLPTLPEVRRREREEAGR